MGRDDYKRARDKRMTSSEIEEMVGDASAYVPPPVSPIFSPYNKSLNRLNKRIVPAVVADALDSIEGYKDRQKVERQIKVGSTEFLPSLPHPLDWSDMLGVIDRLLQYVEIYEYVEEIFTLAKQQETDLKWLKSEISKKLEALKQLEGNVDKEEK